MKKVLALILALVMSLSLVACGGGSTTDAQPSSGAASGDKVIKVGVFQPTSGQNAGGGKQETLGIQYAHDLYPTINIGGEEYTIELVYADNASDTAKAPTAAQALISAGVSVVCGTFGSGCAIAAGDLFNQAQVPAIGTSCTNPQVTLGNDYYFRVCYIDPFQGAVMADFALKKGCKNCAILIEAGDDYSAGFGNYFKEAMVKGGGQATVLEFQKGETDFTTVMANVKQNNYDGIFAPTSLETAALIINQARESGYTAPIMAGDTWDNVSLADRTGANATDIYFSAFFDASDESNAAGKDFADGFLKWVAEDSTRIEYNAGSTTTVSSNTPCGYDSYMAAYYAIEKAQSTDGAAIRDALASLEVPGLVMGDLKFDANGDAIKNYAVIKTIENGDIVYFSSFNG